ncbi:MAG: Uma2 family endonuclease [Cyanobacteria bacterium J06635_1]
MVASISKTISLEDWLKNPPDRTEWVNGAVIEKDAKAFNAGDMTAKHGRTQARLARHWGNYMLSSQVGGEVYTETPCRTINQGRRPDVAHLTPELLVQYGTDFEVLPQAFPLIAEIISPTDDAEEAFAKAAEYLQSGCQEVWLLMPEVHHIFVQTASQRFWYTAGDIAKTQKVLLGFEISVDALLGDLG